MAEAAVRKKAWPRVAFGEVVQLCKERFRDQETNNFERYVGLEHLDPGELKIRRWGNAAGGTTFTNVFRPGHVLFGKRRAYQKKVAVADFNGVCSGDIYVIETKDPNVLLPELVPFICQTDAFFEHAVGTSAGSLSPRTNWKSLATYEFALPPLEEQRRMVQALSACLTAIDTLGELASRAEGLAESHQSCAFESLAADGFELRHLVQPDGLVRGPFGGSLKKKIFVPSGFAVYEQSHAIRGDFSEVRYFIDEAKFDSMTRFQLAAGDLIMSCSGTIGKVAVVPETAAPGVINQALLKIRPDHSRVRSSFLAAYFRSPSFIRAVAGLSVGSAMANVASVRLLEKLRCPVPSLAEQDQIIEILAGYGDLRAAVTARMDEARGMSRLLLSSISR